MWLFLAWRESFEKFCERMDTVTVTERCIEE